MTARPLTSKERDLVRWLVPNGHPSVRSCANQVEVLEVVCESQYSDRLVLDFLQLTGPRANQVMLAEFFERDSQGQVTTVVLFGLNGRLMSLEIWAAEGERVPQLPKPESLHEIT